MIYNVQHVTTYQYAEPVLLSHNEVRLMPRAIAQRQGCDEPRLDILPQPDVRSEWVDYFGNRTLFVTVQERHQSLEFRAKSSVEVHAFTPPAESQPWEEIRDELSGAQARNHLAAVEFAFESYYVKTDECFLQYALESFTPRRPIIEAARDLTRRIHADFKYDTGATDINTSVKQVFEMRRGVCQDFAHLELSCLRSIGLAGRYVSGYLLTTAPAGKTRLVGADASHAWVSVYCDKAGWIDFDPTNDLVVSDKHIWLAWGRDYGDVSPIKGVILGGGKHTIEVSVDVQPMNEDSMRPV